MGDSGLRNPIPAYRTFANHKNLFQNLFKDKVDLSNIPNDLKTMIMEQSTIRLSQYEPAKFTTRSETKCSVLDTKQILSTKKKRLESVFTEGFFSDPKELYKPIGQVVVDTKDLLYSALQLEISTRESKETAAQKEATQQKQQKMKMKMKFKEIPKQNDDGFQKIKSKLHESQTRIGSVKFGVPFCDVVDKDVREKVYDDPVIQAVPVQPTSNTINWSHLEIDEDRKAFFTNTYNKYLSTLKENNIPNSQSSIKESDGTGQTHGQPRKGKSLKVKPQQPTQTPHIQRGLSKGGGVNHQQEPEIKQVLSTKQMETILEIERTNNFGNASDKFFNTRDDFYETRSKLNFRLSDELDRLDSTRQKSYEQKVKFFHISKMDGSNDIKVMRKKTEKESRLKSKRILANHAWYNELINKVVVLNGAKREVTPQEMVILDQIKRLIEDEVKFTKQVFFNLVSLLPTKDFQKDDVQRIIRFVKAHETINEREYIEVVENAGHI